MGGFSGRFITGHLAELLGWRGAFVSLAIMNLIGALLVLWLLLASRRFVPSRNVSGVLSTLGRHLQHKRLMASCAAGFCVLFSLVGTFTYVNFCLASSPFNLSASGIYYMTYYAGGAVGTWGAGIAFERWGWHGSVTTIALVQGLAAIIVVAVWDSKES